MNALLLVKPYDVEQRLLSMALNTEILQEAGRSGKLARSTSTPFHPKWYAGNVMYSNALATLGELASLASGEWRREDPAGHPLVVNHTRKIAVAVASSDRNTGNAQFEKPPSTRPAKGIRTEEAVEENQMLLFPDLSVGGESRHELAGYEFWWLLMHADEAKNELRLEFSRGIRFSTERSVAGWGERIMLAAQPLDEGGILILGDPYGNGPEGGEYDVEVTKLG
jgi:hypothetical protein